MGTSRVLGIVLLVVGCALLGMAYSGSQSVVDQTRHMFTGHFGDRTTFMLLGGAIAAVAGITLLVPRRRLGYGA